MVSVPKTSSTYSVWQPASATRIRVKIGATRDGRLTAAEAHLDYEAGAIVDTTENTIVGAKDAHMLRV